MEPAGALRHRRSPKGELPGGSESMKDSAGRSRSREEKAFARFSFRPLNSDFRFRRFRFQLFLIDASSEKLSRQFVSGGCQDLLPDPQFPAPSAQATNKSPDLMCGLDPTLAPCQESKSP